jgi:hypothetical protein
MKYQICDSTYKYSSLFLIKWSAFHLYCTKNNGTRGMVVLFMWIEHAYKNSSSLFLLPKSISSNLVFLMASPFFQSLIPKTFESFSLLKLSFISYMNENVRKNGQIIDYMPKSLFLIVVSLIFWWSAVNYVEHVPQLTPCYLFRVLHSIWKKLDSVV